MPRPPPECGLLQGIPSGMNGLRLLNVYPETISDGVGLRYSIYLSGCSHCCTGCHNPGSWSPLAGAIIDDAIVERIISEINANPLLDGVTFSGGDPFFNPEGFYGLLKAIKLGTGKNVWCYTGFLYEELAFVEKYSKALKYIDVLVDGRFIKDLHDPRLYFRGSSNQRVLMLKDGEAVGEYRF